MHSSKEKPVWDTLAFVLRTLLTFVVVFILLVQANGYAIDFHRLRLAKIGLLYIHPSPPDVAASLNIGTFTRQGQNLVAELPPGQYTVTLRKSDYQPWQQTVRIQAGRSSAFPFATLFLAEPVLLAQRPATASELISPLVDEKLRVSGGELWAARAGSEQLVTRYLPSIRSARLFDSGHVIVQLGSEIHLLDLDGSNDRVLVTLGDSHQRRLLPIDTKTIGLLDVNQVTTYRIR